MICCQVHPHPVKKEVEEGEQGIAPLQGRNTGGHASPSGRGGDGARLDLEGRTQCSRGSARGIDLEDSLSGWTARS